MDICNYKSIYYQLVDIFLISLYNYNKSLRAAAHIIMEIV